MIGLKSLESTTFFFFCAYIMDTPGRHGFLTIAYKGSEPIPYPRISGISEVKQRKANISYEINTFVWYYF